MRLLQIVLIAVCCTSCRHGQPVVLAPQNQITKNPAVDPNRWLCDAKFEGATFVFTVPDTLLRSTSKWRADSDRLPLSPNRAEAAAISKARKLRPDVQAWSCHSLALHRADADVWFYSVILFRTDIPSAGLPDFLTIPVLMSGVAVEPVGQHAAQK